MRLGLTNNAFCDTIKLSKRKRGLSAVNDGIDYVNNLFHVQILVEFENIF